MTVLIADDHAIWRNAIGELFEKHPDVKKVLFAANGIEALQKLESANASLLILDLNMPILDGLGVLTELAKTPYPNLRVVVMSVLFDRYTVKECLRFGILGYVLKNIEPQIIDHLIQNVKVQAPYYSKEIIQLLNLEGNPLPGESMATEDLTRQEIEVLKLICVELSNEEIGERLFIATSTVKKHRQNIKLKTGIKSTIGFVLFAINEGYYKPKQNLS